MVEFIELFVVGIGIGTFGALVGIGGGMIMVPLFMLTMMAPNGSTFANVQQVIGTSLFWRFVKCPVRHLGLYSSTSSHVQSGNALCFSDDPGCFSR